MSNNSSGLFRVIVSFTGPDGSSLATGRWTVKVKDQDPLLDATLAEGLLEKDGSVGMLISVSDISSLDSPGERTPDLYFVLYRDGKKVLTTEVLKNVEFEKLDPVTGRATGSTTQSFGPFVVADNA
ncbi:MAG: hypothetical protein L3J22_08530 [Xanthomonadales bacterium]|nr:hypothetical protein [Xanthomonadales bacterium]